MIRFRTLSLKRKLVVVMMLTSVVAVAIAGVAGITYEYVRFHRSLVQEVTTAATIISANCSAALAFQDAKAAGETLGALRAQSEIVQAWLFTSDHRVLASYANGPAWPPPAESGFGYRFVRGHLLVCAPVQFGDATIGRVCLRVSLRQQWQRTGVYLAILGGVILGALAVALWLSARLARMVSQPIVALTRATQAVSRDRDYALRVERGGDDEVGQLVDGFNEMLDAIQVRDAKLQAEEQRFRQLAESIREVFWMTDRDNSKMLYISPGYEQVWGRTCASLYATPLSWLEAVHPDDRDRIRHAAVTKQTAGTYDEEYRIERPDGSVRWVRDRAFPIRDEQTGEVYRIAGLAEDITETKKDREAVRRLSVQILRSQDEERRRIARELHDTTAQDLIGLGLTLANLNRAAALTPVDHQQLAEALELVKKCTHELRTLSYVLHPPSLEQLGLPAAARFYVQGFSKRTNLAVTLEVDDDLGRFGAETELALFRVLQESLTNIQKHSGSTTARLRLALDGNRVVLEVQDNGRGFAGPGNGDEMALGVGLSSMRERLEQLGGELVLQSNDGGTSLRAALPVTVA